MPGSKIVTICGAELPEPGKPNKDALRAVNELRRAIKSGEVIGFAAVRLHADRATSWETAGNIGGYSAIGAAVVMTERLRRINGGE